MAPDTAPVGVLALQGDFELHEKALARAGRPSRRVRRPAELAGCGALIIPGGESTTLTRLIDRAGLREPILEFAARGGHVLGTCAGLIMLATRIDEDPARHGVRPLGLLDVLVRRNGYGRQVDSFVDEVEMTAAAAGALGWYLGDGTAEVAGAADGGAGGEAAPGGARAAVPATMQGVFIRAPRILEVGNGVEVIARHRGEPVGVRSGNVVGLTFHPEALAIA